MHRAFISAIQFAAVIELSSVPEPAFFHNMTGGRIIYEEVAPKALEALDIEIVVYHQPHGFRTYTLIPIRFGHPIANFNIILSDADIAFAIRKVANITDSLARFLQFDCPGAIVAENVTDYGTAFLHRLVRRPSGPRPHIGVGSVFEQSLRIAFAPGLSINLSVSIASINSPFFSEDAPSDERNPPQQFVQGG